MTVFRLRTGHNRLSYHLYSKLCIDYTEQCPCGTGSQTTEHLQQSCPIYEPLRKGIWPDHTPVARKFYGSLRDLRCTATFIQETGVSIWWTRRRILIILSQIKPFLVFAVVCKFDDEQIIALSFTSLLEHSISLYKLKQINRINKRMNSRLFSDSCSALCTLHSIMYSRQWGRSRLNKAFRFHWKSWNLRKEIIGKQTN